MRYFIDTPESPRYDKTMKKAVIPGLCAAFISLFSSCYHIEEYAPGELEALSVEGLEEILAKTRSKPWRGEAYAPGPPGGVWHSGVTAEPKSFNLLVAERDATTSAIVSSMHDMFLDYDVVRREWKPRCASPEIVVDGEAGTLSVIYTLRENLFWSFYGSGRKVPVTSDDVIFWYDEIEGDPAFHSSSYNSQFISLEDGSEARIVIEKIDDRRFAFRFPRIDANPLLATNRNFGPRFIYEKAKREGGVDGVLALFSIASDPKTIPSMGQWFLTGYVPGLRLVFRRNPDYWEKDSAGYSYPYVEENVMQILSDTNTQFLVFREGGLETYSARPEDLDELIRDQGRARKGIFNLRKNPNDYTIFNAEGSLGASLWSFNQNPKNAGAPWYEWFTKKEFRQAMSCLLNRDRIIAQVYRGLAEPKLDFFPPPNPYYNPDIRLGYLYDPQRALELLASIGMKRDAAGVMRDAGGRAVEFNLSIPADANTYSDTASVVMDEAAKIGIRINIRATDFQKLVEQLTATHDWASIFIGLGITFFPTQGSNVWPSTGNLHLWHPLQEKPATDWEARIDYLYNEGSYTIDREKAQKIWDEYQEILLEQCPVIYLMRPRSFFALQNRWDFTNFYYDNMVGADTSRLYLRP
ncbi:MAG: ABC transporter substrate-binding protein [Treponema sp.]|jgi:peptide/nickel transport system substrate-binding protein|nr:ABC transporter substrate-binding protein [Treponema sp.]